MKLVKICVFKWEAILAAHWPEAGIASHVNILITPRIHFFYTKQEIPPELQRIPQTR